MEKEAVIKEVEENYIHYHHLAKLMTRFLEWNVNEVLEKKSLSTVKFRAKSALSVRGNYDLGKYSTDPTHKNYKKTSKDIHDLAGGRLIFTHMDELEKFIESVMLHRRKWFGGQVDIQAKIVVEPARMVKVTFGYDSYHAIFTVHRGTEFWNSLKPEDQNRFEKLDPMRCEIQFRTLLQDVFAESAHKYHYKLEHAPSAKTTKLWGMLAAQLTIADENLKDLKMEFEEHHPDKNESHNQWQPWKNNTSHHAFESNGVYHPYELLLEKKDVPKIRVSWELFDVDKTMVKKHSIKNYKKKVWSLLPQEMKNRITHDTVVVRVKNFIVDNNTLLIQPAQYSDQAVTNHKFALKTMLDGQKVKSLNLRNGELFKFSKSPFSNTIGVSCVIRTLDEQWIISKRSNEVVFEGGKAGCSASGALEWGERDTWNTSASFDWIKQGMIRECEEELGFQFPLEGALEFIGFAREIERSGKPQFFFLIDCKKSKIDYTAENADAFFWLYSDKEADSLMFLSDSAVKDAVSNSPNKVQKALQGTIPSNELRMNLALAIKSINN